MNESKKEIGIFLDNMININYLNSIIYGNGMFITVGNDGTILTSK